MIRTAFYYTDSSSFGGVERAMLQHMEWLERKDWAPTLIHHAAAGISVLLQEAQQLDVRLVEIPPLPLGLSGARRVPAFAAMLRAERPAVFHAHLSWPQACKWGLVSAILAKVPVVVATCHLWVDAPYTLASRWQQRMLTARLGKYIAVSPEIAWKLERIFHVPGSKVQILRSSVNYDRYENSSRLPPPPEMAHLASRPVILTVARLDEQKGLPTLIEAAAQVPDATFVLVGEGPERPALQALCQKLGLNGRVIFAGFQQDIPAWLGHCSLFVLPSLYEGVPLSLLEAMAAGRPVIASQIPGNREAVTHGETGWLVPPGDAVALAEAIRLLLADSKLAQRLAVAGQARARSEFSSQAMVRQVVQVYTSLFEKAQQDGQGHA
jgi:glycosyltransferase involved in cell wall biosynthesis